MKPTAKLATFDAGRTSKPRLAFNPDLGLASKGLWTHTVATVVAEVIKKAVKRERGSEPEAA